jgi:hypothetical protein
MVSLRFRCWPWRACLALCAVLSLTPLSPGQDPGQSQGYVNAQMPWHTAVLDSQSKLLAWYRPEKNLGYDQVLRLTWDFLERKVPIDTEKGTGLKIYLTFPIFEEKTLQGIVYQHGPASLFAHLVDEVVNWYPYSGDTAAIGVVREMLDYQMAHGTTPNDWDWAAVPFATSCPGDKEYGRCISDMPRQFYGGIETDKVAELGLGYVNFYEMTGEQKYLDAGLRCADALVKHVRPGDAEHTPWPFRVDAHSGDPIAGEQFGGMVVASVRLFDELVRLGVGDSAGYRKTRDLAWQWILSIQLTENPALDRWSGYYEDVPKDTINVNDQSSMMTAYYILSQDDPGSLEPNPAPLRSWQTHVGYLLDRSRGLLGRGPFFGAWAIDEQQHPVVNIPGLSGQGCCSRAGLSCRTAAWGAINAMYYERTGDASARENAFRSLNYATYFMDSEGKFACCGVSHGSTYWFEDGYADAGRNLMWALGAIPEFAPVGQNHIVRSSSVIQNVKYDERSVDYKTFDNKGVAVLRLKFKPVQVTAGGKLLSERSDLQQPGYTLQPLTGGDYVVRVRHSESKEVAVIGR